VLVFGNCLLPLFENGWEPHSRFERRQR